MDGDWNEWVEDEDEEGAGHRRRRRTKREHEVDVEVDPDDDELAEWKRERGSKGRKPIDERRPRHRKGEDDEEF